LDETLKKPAKRAFIKLALPVEGGDVAADVRERRPLHLILPVDLSAAPFG
jgi:hypothetical protein